MNVAVESREKGRGSRLAPAEIRPAVLALQGSVEPHRRALERLGFDAIPVRRPEALEGISHLVLPGGESTTLHDLLAEYGIWPVLERRGREGSLAIFGTCAGAILLGRDNPERPPRLGLVDVGTERNAYGRQIDSFVVPLRLREPIGEIEGVFIRSPRLVDPGPEVEILGSYRGDVVAARQGRVLVATFHPELTASLALHEYFLKL